MVSELSRLGRSLGQVIQAVDELLKQGVGLIAIKESIRLEGKQDLQTKVTIALFGLVRRDREGLDLRADQGGAGGRPGHEAACSVARKVPSANRSSTGKKTRSRCCWSKKVSKASIAKILDVAPSTLHSFIQSRRLESKKRRWA